MKDPEIYVLAKWLAHNEPELIDLAILGGRIDSDIAEIANEWHVGNSVVYRAISTTIRVFNV